MGLINNDIFESSNGVQKSGTYISFNNETLYLRKPNKFYVVPVPVVLPAPVPVVAVPLPAPIAPASEPSASEPASSEPSAPVVSEPSAPVAVAAAPIPAVQAPQMAYSVHANYRIYWDKSARDAGKSFIELRSISAEVPESALTRNLYEVLYESLKAQYPNSENEMTVR